jgi:general secretion pathway protein H
MTGRTSPTSERRDRRGGFTLLELALALVILSLMAALALPRVYPGSGATAARTTAYAIAALLRADRNTALATGVETSTRVDGRQVASMAGGAALTVPRDFELQPRGVTGGLVRFTPDGRSSGGVLVLRRGDTAYSVRVDPLTGGVMILTGAL